MIALDILVAICFLCVSGQLVSPNLPRSPQLPSPQQFLETLFNVTATELTDLISDFSFDEVLANHISFLLYTQNGTIITLNMNSDYHYIKKNEPIKFVIHGWQSTGDQDFIKDFAKAYHSIGIHNVFGVDWSSHSKRSYVHAARGTKTIGTIVGRFIMNILNNDTKLLKNVHLIGHSLGAQISGFAGKHIQSVIKGAKIGRITALDAAAPLFEFPVRVPGDSRLMNDDAEYVDAMHTNAGFLGLLSPFAHADFYVDFGGPIQAGCMQINLFEAFVCSHIKSYNIYNRTITTKNYVATECDNPFAAVANLCDNNKKVIMGEHTSPNVTGEYFIKIDNNNLPEETSNGLLQILGSIPRRLG